MPALSSKVRRLRVNNKNIVTTYPSIEAAIRAENCNDSLHIIYPEEMKQAASLFLEGFDGTCMYAVKANPNPFVLQVLWQAGIKEFDVASLREIELVKSLFPRARMHFMHPIKSREAIRYAYSAGVRTFSFDHGDELRKISSETQGATDLTLMLRLDVATSAAAYALSGKFGASLEEAPFLLQQARQITNSIGICFHVGSQCMNPDDYASAISAIATMLNSSGIQIDMLDVGGGFPVDYPGMQPPPMHEYFSVINSAVSAHGFDGIKLYCEPGRALVAEAGSVATRVELRKGNDLYLNDGTYGALFDAGTSEWPFELELIPNDERSVSSESLPFRLFGPTCDSIDKMEGPFILPADTHEGDWVVFEHLGAYGYTLQSRFNGFYSETVVAIVPPIEQSLSESDISIEIAAERYLL